MHRELKALTGGRPVRPSWPERDDVVDLSLLVGSLGRLCDRWFEAVTEALGCGPTDNLGQYVAHRLILTAQLVAAAESEPYEPVLMSLVSDQVVAELQMRSQRAPDSELLRALVTLPAVDQVVLVRYPYRSSSLDTTRLGIEQVQRLVGAPSMVAVRKSAQRAKARLEQALAHEKEKRTQ